MVLPEHLPGAPVLLEASHPPPVRVSVLNIWHSLKSASILEPAGSSVAICHDDGDDDGDNDDDEAALSNGNEEAEV